MHCLKTALSDLLKKDAAQYNFTNCFKKQGTDGMLPKASLKTPQLRVHQLPHISSSLALYALDRVITEPGQNKLRQTLSLAFPSTDDNFPGN